MDNIENGLSQAEVERLALLMEEAAEVQQIIGKILRHGYESYHPDNVNVSNRQLLEKEVGDLLAAISISRTAGDFSLQSVLDAFKSKMKRVGQYLHFNYISDVDKGCADDVTMRSPIDEVL